MKPVFLGAGSIMSGSGYFIFLRIPEDWHLMPSPIPPEGCTIRVVDGVPWIDSGQIRVVLAATSEGRASVGMELEVKTRARRKHKDLRAWLEKTVSDIRSGRGKTLESHGEISISGHKGAYVFWTEEKKSLKILGKHVTEGHLRCIFYCDETGREIEISLWTRKAGFMRDAFEKILRIISSIECHSYNALEEMEEYEEDVNS